MKKRFLETMKKLDSNPHKDFKPHKALFLAICPGCKRVHDLKLIDFKP